jgi:hypothetical protein
MECGPHRARRIAKWRTGDVGGVEFIRQFFTALSGDHSRHSLNEKAGQSARVRIVVRLRFDVT